MTWTQNKTIDLVLWIRKNKVVSYIFALLFSMMALILFIYVGHPDRGGCMLVFFALVLAIPQASNKVIVDIIRTSKARPETERMSVVRLFDEGASVLLQIELVMALIGTLVWGFA